MSAHGFLSRFERGGARWTRTVKVPGTRFNTDLAPERRPLIVRVTDGADVWVLPFPCYCSASGWKNARTGSHLAPNLQVTGWRYGESTGGLR